MKKTKIKIPIYGGRLTVIQTKNLEPVVKKYGLNQSSIESNAFVFNDPKEGKFRLYAVFKNVDNDIIVHEAVHVVNFIFEYYGVQLDRVNDETQAYLTMWVFNKMRKHLKNDSKGNTKGD